jgi:hypothetical protein
MPLKTKPTKLSPNGFFFILHWFYFKFQEYSGHYYKLYLLNIILKQTFWRMHNTSQHVDDPSVKGYPTTKHRILG